MKKLAVVSVLILCAVLCGCGLAAPAPTPTPTVILPTPAPTPVPTPTPTPPPPLDVDADGNFELYGKVFNLNDACIDLRKVPVEDEGKAVESMLPYMPNLKTLDMDNCGVGNERMAPQCDINTTTYDPHLEGWRYETDEDGGFCERFALLVDQFGYDKADYAYPWRDPYWYND